MADSDFNRKHPRDEDGKFTNKHGGSAAGSRERLENIYDSDKRGVLEKEKKKNTLTNSASHSKIPSFPKARGFKNDKSRRAHEKHVAEMGFKSFEEYESAAVKFLDLEWTGCEIFEAKNHRWYKYQESTNRLGIVGTDNNIITFFCPKRERRYYLDWKEKMEV